MADKEIDVNIDSDALKVSPQIKFVNLRNLLKYIGEKLSLLLESRRIGIYLKGRETGNWALAISRDLAEPVETQARVINQDKAGELKKSITTRQVCLLEEILDPGIARKITGENLIVTPMVCDDDVVALLLADFDAYANLTDRHLIQLTLAAKLIKTAVEREFLALQVSRLEKNLSERSIPREDEMFHSEKLVAWVINREIERTLRHGSSFAVLLVAFDNLEHVLSERGSRIAEQVLTEQFEVLNHIVRKCDLLTRRGGGHYLIVTMEQDAAGAMVLAAKIRHRIKEGIIRIDGTEIAMTVSIGVALYPDGPKCSAGGLIKRAESALAESRERGNRAKLWRSADSAIERTREIKNLKKPPAARKISDRRRRSP